MNLYRVVRAVKGALARAWARARGIARSRAWGLENPNAGKTPTRIWVFQVARCFLRGGCLTTMEY